ncbi:MAG: glycoside hydrolase family 127 protein, partial [Prevotella sp.]|nr:glycoside hydrolase family 127 protein [Prevotella sp.]
MIRIKKVALTSLSILLTLSVHAQSKVNGYPITPVPFTQVKITPNTFWGQRMEANRMVTIPLAFSKCESEGRYENFVKAAHPSDEYDVSKFMGFSFDDTDVYKTIEGASYVLRGERREERG